MLLGDVRDLGQGGAVHAAHAGREADVEVAVLLLVDAHVVAPLAGRLLGRGAVGQLPLQVLVLQDLAELGRPPVGDEELQAGAGAQPAVAVVAEDRDDALVDIRDLVQRDPGAQAHTELGVGGETAADPDVEARTVLGVVHAHERDVVDLVRHVEQGRAGDGGLELAGQVGEVLVAHDAAVDLVDGGGAVDDLVLRDAGDGRAEDDAGRVTAGLGGREADGLQPTPDLRDVLDPDPVVLHVLAVGEVGGAARELLGDLADDAELLGGQPAAVDADAQHEVLVVQLFRLQDRGLAAVDPGLALGVEAPPAHAAAQVVGVDRVEAPLGVDRLNACPHVETVVVLLELLVAVEGRVVSDGPLALTAVTAGLAARGCGCGCRRFGGGGHGGTSFFGGSRQGQGEAEAAAYPCQVGDAERVWLIPAPLPGLPAGRAVHRPQGAGG